MANDERGTRRAEGRTVVTFEAASVEQLVALRPVGVALEELERVLHTHPAALVAAAYGQAPPPAPVVVPLAAGGRLVRLKVRALVELSTPEPEQGTPTISLTWRAVRREHSFPRLEGTLSARSGADGGAVLRLEARYRPPAGLLGLVVDRLAGRHFAVATTRDFVERLAALLEGRQQGEPGAPSEGVPPEGAR